jgi:hypothetical protein
MEFQPRIGEDVVIKTTEDAILRCDYMGLAFQDGKCVHVYKHRTSDVLATSENQVAVPYEKACVLWN